MSGSRAFIAERIFLLEEGRRRGQTDVPSLFSCPGTDIHEPVGRKHGLCVMLHHHDGIAFVAQLLERGYEFTVVPLVQSYARFI